MLELIARRSEHHEKALGGHWNSNYDVVLDDGRERAVQFVAIFAQQVEVVLLVVKRRVFGERQHRVADAVDGDDSLAPKELIGS